MFVHTWSTLSFSMTMPDHTRALRQLQQSDALGSLSSIILHTVPTWPHPTFICFLNLKNTSEDCTSIVMKRCKTKCGCGSVNKVKHSTVTVSRNWSLVGRNVFVARVTMLRNRYVDLKNKDVECYSRLFSFNRFTGFHIKNLEALLFSTPSYNELISLLQIC